uniref:CCR4-NOT transcription complex subunit 11 n=3 Tax=Globodera pallida TaxID=36090 RepID=A0A183CKM4_GLOPA
MKQQLAPENPEKVGGIQTHPDGRVTNIPSRMLNDQFGMAGLLTFLRAIEGAPSIVGLALGHDLSNLGLNLNASKRNLFQTFGGPWADFPCRIQDLDAKVPDEYLTNATIRDKLPHIKMQKLHEDVLFYLFYNCPGEVYQVAAASELYVRDWRFHKVERVWLTRAPLSAAPREIGGSYERSSYLVFDPIQWRRVPREMVLECTDLEGKPSVLGSQSVCSSAAVGSTPLVARLEACGEGTSTLTTTTMAPNPSTSVGENSPHGSVMSSTVGQLWQISRGNLPPKSEMRLLLNILQENPEIFGRHECGDLFLNFMQYEPEIAGILLAFQLMYDFKAYGTNLELLLGMEPNVQVLEVVNKFVKMCEYKSLPIPEEFLNKFITLCISACEKADATHDTAAAHRLVRMVCGFFTFLLSLNRFNSMARRLEIQSFATSFLSLREASLLYQKVLENVAN